jgi:hypothetical protein
MSQEAHRGERRARPDGNYADGIFGMITFNGKTGDKEDDKDDEESSGKR